MRRKQNKQNKPQLELILVPSKVIHWQRCPLCGAWTLRATCLRCEMGLDYRPLRYQPEKPYGMSGISPIWNCGALFARMPKRNTVHCNM